MQIIQTYEQFTQGSIQRTFLLDIPITYPNTITELPLPYELALISKFQTEIDTCKANGTKFNFVMDLTPLLQCVCYVDTREIILNDGSEFDQKMQSYWRDFDFDIA